MSEVTYLPAIEASRLETGAVQFGDDWPGVFIRGDNALYFSFMLRNFLDKFKNDEEFFNENWLELTILESLYKTLASCRT